MNKLINQEEHYCVMCGKKFIRRKNRYSKSYVRPVGSVTCSSKCSKLYYYTRKRIDTNKNNLSAE